jgi:hypothetical protein
LTRTAFVWERDGEMELDPDRRIQQAIRTVFRLFDRLGSARQVLLRMREDRLLFPRPDDGKQLTKKTLGWRPPVYRNIISVLQSPVYAGAYAYGRSEPRTTLVQGRLQKTYGHERSMDKWTVLLRDQHAQPRGVRGRGAARHQRAAGQTRTDAVGRG